MKQPVLPVGAQAATAAAQQVERRYFWLQQPPISASQHQYQANRSHSLSSDGKLQFHLQQCRMLQVMALAAQLQELAVDLQRNAGTAHVLWSSSSGLMHSPAPCAKLHTLHVPCPWRAASGTP